jgi:molybdate transport system ATP-binding protein
MIKIDISKQLHGSSGDLDLNINLMIEKNDFICITGPSGSGKTTLLRILAGLENSYGKITFNDEVWQDAKNILDPQKRNIGFVFQDYALFENMTVLENLLFVNKDIELASKLLHMTGLQELSNRYPKKLSGGQKQRVSLCRAMMNRPQLLLMDEPLSALDIKTRAKLQEEIKQFHKEFGTTTILISHDIAEIQKLSHRLIIIDNGKVIDDGKPETLLKNFIN